MLGEKVFFIIWDIEIDKLYFVVERYWLIVLMFSFKFVVIWPFANSKPYQLGRNVAEIEIDFT